MMGVLREGWWLIRCWDADEGATHRELCAFLGRALAKS